MELKLNTRRTFFIGLAFFAILMLWRVHLHHTPLLLTRLLQDHLGGDREYRDIVGIIMAIDNVLAIFLLPLFGMWSDRTKNRLGKRMTFILVGGVLSVILFPLIAAMFLVNSLVWFIIMVALMKVAMNLWRGPAVALMPDITPKPLRAKANAIINFVGYIGAILGSILVMIFGFDLDIDSSQPVAMIPFFVTAVLMLAIILILTFRFKENKVVEEMRDDMCAGECLSETLQPVKEDKPLSKRDKWNLWIVMAAVFMAWFAFNALDTFGSLYEQYRFDTTQWGLLGAILGVAALLAFLPCIKLTRKIGRKNSVLVGIAVVTLSLVVANFMPSVWALAPLFAISGAGWALVNISAFPIVVEMASAKNIGKITGIYYIATQSAQALTSIFAGQVFEHWLGFGAFWWYPIIFMSLAFIICLFFRPRKVELSTATESSPEETDEEAIEEKEIITTPDTEVVITEEENLAK